MNSEYEKSLLLKIKQLEKKIDEYNKIIKRLLLSTKNNK